MGSGAVFSQRFGDTEALIRIFDGDIKRMLCGLVEDGDCGVCGFFSGRHGGQLGFYGVD